MNLVEAHGVETQNEHLILTTNRWANLKGEFGYPIIPKELCGGKSTIEEFHNRSAKNQRKHRVQ
jgi:hypothetical protein